MNNLFVCLFLSHAFSPADLPDFMHFGIFRLFNSSFVFWLLCFTADIGTLLRSNDEDGFFFLLRGSFATNGCKYVGRYFLSNFDFFKVVQHIHVRAPILPSF